MRSGRWRSAPARPALARVRDGALAGLVCAGQLVGTHFAARHQGDVAALDALGYALLAAGPAALLGRRRWPGTALVVAFGLTVAYAAIGYPAGPVFLALVVAFFTAVQAGRRLIAYPVLAAGYVVFLFGVDYFRPAPGPAAAFGLAAWLLVLAAASEIVRFRGERAAEAARSRAQEARRRAGEERLRVARELHDAIGHHLSLISVQSGVALHLLDEGGDAPGPARSALRAVNAASRQALTELRSVLAVFRDVDEPAPHSPGPDLGGLAALVERARAAGLPVRLERTGDVRPVPVGVGAAAYRIVQEALTNVVRHAGPAAATLVRVDYGARELVVLVEDWGGGTAAAHAGEGSGLAGMRERAAALGGELAAGPGPRGGFRVLARLPLAALAEPARGAL